jgi:hypothetical protein
VGICRNASRLDATGTRGILGLGHSPCKCGWRPGQTHNDYLATSCPKLPIVLATRSAIHWHAFNQYCSGTVILDTSDLSSAMDRGPQSQGQVRRFIAESRAALLTQRIRFRAMSYPRKRAVTACESCRVRKTKCDNARPRCASCIKNSLPCSYDPRLDHSSWVQPWLRAFGIKD